MLQQKIKPVAVAQADTQAVTTKIKTDAKADAIERYFTLFNLGRYQDISELFSEDGHLYPPFETPVIGREAIATYLTKEADGMEIEPLTVERSPSSENDGITNVQVRGIVTALVFKVNVAWEFKLTSHNEIAAVSVNLLATLEELLNLRSA